jgi:hypothetical protein
MGIGALAVMPSPSNLKATPPIRLGCAILAVLGSLHVVPIQLATNLSGLVRLAGHLAPYRPYARSRISSSGTVVRVESCKWISWGTCCVALIAASPRAEI